MPYVPKTDWRYDETVAENDLNRIEGGIQESLQKVDAITPAQIGAETPAGAQAKVDAHKNTTTGAHAASAISIEDTASQFTASNVEEALAELFTSVDNGKAQIKTAIIAKGGTVAGTAPHSFQELTNGIAGIATGKRFASGSAVAGSSTGNPVTVTGLAFSPKIIILVNPDSDLLKWIIRNEYDASSAIWQTRIQQTTTSGQTTGSQGVTVAPTAGGFTGLTWFGINATTRWYAVE
ncbi:hypothetical protein CIG75_18905 [Tumebacillus algifaecis]|uniref:Uncharacterized protein n=1 Tax=Tumebacillus algifaecis TaxID=1214604 RepID=A0A223D5I2_9BACL|nr:hypothetical protein [Tumebacillus algifaecis]ASS76805.1 hypothetical protein CIG75_18905 [Tumebacillus algifaecis]